MTTLNDLVDEVLLDLTSYGLYQPRLTSLTTSATDSDTTLNVASTTGFSSGLVEIDDELVFAQSADSTALTLSVVRGYRTTAAAHADGATVTANPPWPRAMVKNAINDAIASSYPTLFKVATTDFTAKSVDSTYDLPGADKILRIGEEKLSPQTGHYWINRYDYDPDLEELTLKEGVRPGATLHVVHSAAPTALTAGADLLTASGLQASAKAYVVLAATAKLVIHMDSSRLPSNSAAADDMEANRTVGSAIQIAKTLLAASEMELGKEQARLRQKYPARINYTKGNR